MQKLKFVVDFHKYNKKFKHLLNLKKNAVHYIRSFIRDKPLKCFSHCCLVNYFRYFVIKLMVELFVSYILFQSNDELFGR